MGGRVGKWVGGGRLHSAVQQAGQCGCHIPVSSSNPIFHPHSPASTTVTPTTVEVEARMPSMKREAMGMMTNWREPSPDRTVCAAKRMAMKRRMLPTAKAAQPAKAYALLPAFCRRHLPSGRRLRRGRGRILSLGQGPTGGQEHVGSGHACRCCDSKGSSGSESHSEAGRAAAAQRRQLTTAGAGVRAAPPRCWVRPWSRRWSGPPSRWPARIQ